MSLPAFRYYSEDPTNPHRLGRHRMHDFLVPERAAAVDQTRPIRTVQHKELLPVFDQGDLGSCTANAALGTLVTEPFAKAGVSYTEDDAVALYRLETQLDDTQIPGSWPPDDTGSTGPWSMLALEKQGRIKSFWHTQTLATALRLLNDGPISIGVTWWNSFFTPGADHVLTLDTESGIGGGHQVCVTGNDVDRELVLIRNSWGLSYGDEGHVWLRWSDFDDLLADGGDVVQPIL